MELAAVFVLSVIGGYAFATHWRYIAFATRRTEGHHVYFRAAFYGTVFFIAAMLLRLWLLAKIPQYSQFETNLSEYIAPALKEPRNPRQVELVITAAYSLIIAPATAVLLNAISPRSWGLRQNLNALDTLLYRAQKAELPVSITLSTGKIYIGLVASITDPDHPPTAIRLLPMFSGFRDDQGRMKLTTDYESVYRALPSRVSGKRRDLQDGAESTNFEVMLREDSIVSATIFSPTLYARFNRGWRKNIRKKPGPKELLVHISRKPLGKAKN